MYFSEKDVTAGLAGPVTGAQHLLVEDLNNDELLDVILTREDQPPQVFLRERGGPFVSTNLGTNLPAGVVLTTGDLDNDSRVDVIVATAGRIEVVFGGDKAAVSLPNPGFEPTTVGLIDYDNDGWRDICSGGSGLRMWRNVGEAGFLDVTDALGLGGGTRDSGVEFVLPVDVDRDCDTDLVIAVAGKGLQVLRNDGGNSNHQLKLRLAGRRSNASGLGVRFSVSAGGLRSWHTVRELPIEVGVGKHAQVDSVAVLWSDGVMNNDEIRVDQCDVLALSEIERPTGSCPYLYAWDGTKFRFVTDLLGAAPLGLRLTDNVFIDDDPREYVWLGDESMFVPRDDRYVVQVTEELREVLYLDEAKLVVVDHPEGTEVHTTGKLLPGKPFPPHELVTLHRRQPLIRAVTHQGQDVTGMLNDRDGRLVSPTRLRPPQLRGLAEPHHIVLDFGPLDRGRPLVLAMTGWLRFGGGMANVGASHTPDLPFPFPRLEVEIAGGDDDSQGGGKWQPVDLIVGAPAGKTKTILVDLAGHLPEGGGRLRLSTAFEIHWDRIALFEKRDNAETQVSILNATETDLHSRGYSEFENWPWYLPLTPAYSRVKSTADWSITPTGWCTRYGAVDELISEEDNALALLNGGDELTLEFALRAVPQKSAGTVRDFFFYSVGWDKDADFHCELGWQVEPLPWHGMDAQLYGKQMRPTFQNDDWIKRYNTRWVGPYTVTEATQARRVRRALAQ